MLCGSKTWFLRKKEMAILRIERTMIRSMRGVKLLDRTNSEKLMDMLGMEKSWDRMVKASNMRWYGHALREEDKNEIVKV